MVILTGWLLPATPAWFCSDMIGSYQNQNMALMHIDNECHLFLRPYDWIIPKPERIDYLLGIVNLVGYYL